MSERVPHTRQCSRCREIKPLTAYYREKNGKYGVRSKCKVCFNTLSLEHIKKNWARHLEYQKRWRRGHPEKCRAYEKDYLSRRRHVKQRSTTNWKAKNPDKVRASKKKHHAAHLIEHRASGAKRRVRKRGASGRGIGARQWKQVLAGALGICAYCNRRAPLALDHIEPLAQGGEHDIENAAAACKSCNSSKNHRPLLVWLARQRMRKGVPIAA